MFLIIPFVRDVLAIPQRIGTDWNHSVQPECDLELSN